MSRPTNIHAVSGIQSHDSSNQAPKIHASDYAATVIVKENY
jgi:hypothetical protein